jgi:hypothetical protein
MYLKDLAASSASKSTSFMNFIGAVQFIDRVADEAKDTMTDFPYAFRSGRYNQPKPRHEKSDVVTCRVTSCSLM